MNVGGLTRFRLTVFKFYLSVLGCLTLLWDPPHPQELKVRHVAHLRDTFLTRQRIRTWGRRCWVCSKVLHPHPDQIHSDRGAGHRKGVENECLHFRYPNWFSGSRRRVRSEIFSARMWPPWYASASSAARGRRHDRRPQARQAHKRYVRVHPPMVGCFSRSGSHLIMWPQCLALPSSAARGRLLC